MNIRKKKVLIIDNNFYNYGRSIEDHLGENYIVKRHQIEIPLNTLIRIYNFGTKKLQEIFKLKKEFPFCQSQIDIISQKIVDVYEQFLPDYVIVIKGDFLSRKSLMKMNRAKIILWMMDSFERYPFLIEDLGLYNHIFVFEKSDIELLEHKGIKAEFLPLCADEHIYYPQDNEKEIDVLFIGAMYPARVRILKRLVCKFPNYNIKIYGYHINRFEIFKRLKYRITNEHNFFFDRVTPEQANGLYSKSKICLNMHNWQSKMGANPRTFEILATKSFELVDYNPYIEEVASEGVVMYSDEDDLFEKIAYYVENETERNKIANSGYKIVSENHCFQNRINRIMEICK